MPVNSDLGGKNYTLGRGRVLFDRFAPNVLVNAATRGEGERYLGNTPEFSTSSESEDLEHFDSDAGVRTKDASVQLSLDRSGSFTCDNIDKENLALYFLGLTSEVVQASATAQVEVHENAKRGRFYQLGVTEANPAGVRNISNVTVRTGGSPGWATTVTPSGNYEVDEVRGQIYVEIDAPGIDDADIQITFDIGASTRDRVISGSNAIYGALRFRADNPKGENLDYYYPYVKLAPDGDYNLKGDDWQAMSFTFEVLKKASNVEAVYIDSQPRTS